MVRTPRRTAARTAGCRELIDARNELDSRGLPGRAPPRASCGDAVPEHERARAEMLIADARQALEEQAPMDRVRPLIGELQQLGAGPAAAAARAGRLRRPASAGSGPDRRADDEDVIDAEFTTH